jgi:hypothetical protein
MSIISKYKTTILVGILVIVAFIVYSYFFTGAPPQALTVTAATSTAEVDQDLIALLTTLKSIKLDAAIFSDPTFQSLQDFSQALVPEPVGRQNPFAPLGSVSIPSSRQTAPASAPTTGH